MKWYTISENVDIDTGEILTKENLKNYVKQKTSITYESIHNGESTIKKLTNEYRHNGQQEISFGTN